MVNIVYNELQFSQETAKYLRKKLQDMDFKVAESFDEQGDLIICVGGDGSFLKALHDYNFPQIPIVGINTGHLGFLAEVDPDGIDYFLESYQHGNYTTEVSHPVEASICTRNSCIKKMGVNEIVIKGDKSRTIHLDISVDDQLLQRFSGDGILISSALGSTAYNYSIGGSIVDPRLSVLQITPLAPINTNAYRSFTSSVILPPDARIKISPEYRFEDNIVLVCDGVEHRYSKITEVDIRIADITIEMIRMEKGNFWNKVINKFL